MKFEEYIDIKYKEIAENKGFDPTTDFGEKCDDVSDYFGMRRMYEEKQEEIDELKTMLYQIYDDIDFDENDPNDFRRFVEKLKGIKSNGISINGVLF